MKAAGAADSRPSPRGRHKTGGRAATRLDLLSDFAATFDLQRARQSLVAWYQRSARSLPWRELWERHRDPYHVWVSEIMLQQTVIKAVIPVYSRFLERFPSVRELAQASEEAVREAVRGLGYYRRFRFLHLAAKALVQQNSPWPTTPEDWQELPGIGDYTSAAIASIAFNAPKAAIDGNVERVICRLLDVRRPVNDPAIKPSVKKRAQELLDKARPGDFNQAMMQLGQLVCTPTKPKCEECPLAFGCLANLRGSQSLAPGPKIKGAEAKDVQMHLLIPRRGQLIGILQRPTKAQFLGGTAGFLTFIDAEERVADGWDELPFWVEWHAVNDVTTVKHSITHHRIKAKVVDVSIDTDITSIEWLEPSQVEARLVSNLDRKAWHGFEAMVGSLFKQKTPTRQETRPPHQSDAFLGVLLAKNP